MKKWVVVTLIAALLIIGGVESNPGPTDNVKLLRTDLDAKLNKITEILGKHANDTKMKLKVMDAKCSGILKELEDINVDVSNLKEKIYGQGWIEKNYRNHNILVCGLNECTNESRWDLCYALQELFAKELQMNISDMMIDDCFRLGKTKNRRPVLIKFTSKITRDCELERSKLLKGTGIYLAKDYDKAIREIRRQLIPFRKEARDKGIHAVLRYEKLIVEGRELDLNFCKMNLGNQRSEDLVDQRREEMGEMLTTAEGGQRSNSELRATLTSDGVSKNSLQSSARSLNLWPANGGGNVRQECQVSMEGNARQQTSIERQRSRSNSGENAGIVRCRKRDNTGQQ